MGRVGTAHDFWVPSTAFVSKACFYLLRAISALWYIGAAATMHAVAGSSGVSEIITVSPGQEFEIVLEGVPASGFTWQLSHDTDTASVIEELGHEWKADTSLVGGRAAEHFRFRALAVGEARLRFQYRRAWESEAREERTFTVRVVPDK